MSSSTMERVIRRAARVFGPREEQEIRQPRTRRAIEREQRERDLRETIRRRIERDVAHYAGETRAEIDRRLAELDREWDVERALQFGLGSIAAVSSLLALLTSSVWTLAALAAGGMLARRARTGRSPADPLARRLGYRTRDEIELEYLALKVLRGDFDGLPGREDIQRDASRARALLAALARRQGEAGISPDPQPK